MWASTSCASEFRGPPTHHRDPTSTPTAVQPWHRRGGTRRPARNGRHRHAQRGQDVPVELQRLAQVAGAARTARGVLEHGRLRMLRIGAGEPAEFQAVHD
jgi:hypothetical protein